jgi:TonB family protein
VFLPAGDGEGAGGGEERGDGQIGGGGGDGIGEGGGGRPPIPFEAARRARLPYTRAAIEAKVGGMVIVSMLVLEDGSVTDVKLLKGLGYGLDPIAVATARQFRFLPALDREGQPVVTRIAWQFRFERPD